MREIIFRGKRTDNKQWVEGFYIKANYHWHNHGIHEDWIATNTIQNGGWCNVRGKHAVDPLTLGQYTGLTDKNGTKIFEGDIVQYYGTYALEVYIENGHTKTRWFDTVTKREYTELFFGYDEEAYGECEVIGNIHDNPELLKGGVQE